MFAFGFFVGALFVLIVAGVTWVVVTQNRSTVIRFTKKVQSYPQAREKVEIIKRKSDAEEAMEHVKALNAQRGGIPDSELRF